MVLISTTTTFRISVPDQSHVGACRRTAREFAIKIGLNSTAVENLSIVITELVSNLAKHTTSGGEILLSDVSDAEQKSVQIISIDRGPGMEDPEAALIFGVSNTNTLGAGLGGVKNLTEHLEISSLPGQGTVILCTVSDKKHKRKKQPEAFLSAGFISVPHPKSTQCGDAFAQAESDVMHSILLVDGLGHGEGASIVAQRACSVFQESPFEKPTKIIERIHRELSGTRGVALALAQINALEGKLSYAGVGNISGRIFMRYKNKGLSSTEGTAGSRVASMRDYQYEWEPAASLLMFSDGIKSTAKLERTAGKSASLLAAEIYRDYSRHNDDVTVVIVKDNRRQSLVDSSSQTSC